MQLTRLWRSWKVGFITILFALLAPISPKGAFCEDIESHLDKSIQSTESWSPIKQHAHPSKRNLPSEHIRPNLIAKVRSLPPHKLHQFKLEAALHVQRNLVRTFRILSTNVQRVPVRIRSAARNALLAAQAGKFTHSIANNLPVILKHASPMQGRPAEQLRHILTAIIPQVPIATRGPLQGILGFVSSNLSNVNLLLSRLLGSVPDLLGGVISSLTNNIGAVTGAVNGVLGSLGVLLGGAIAR